MIVIDTNVLSELMRAKPAPAVVSWFEARPVESLFTTAITQAEILYGVAVLPRGRRRRALEEAVAGMFSDDLAGHVLPFDGAAAEAYAIIAAARRRAGQPISQLDAQIAAIARSRGSELATRNVSDFRGCGITVLDPFSER